MNHVLLFFFTDTATTEIYTLSLHDALPICAWPCAIRSPAPSTPAAASTPRSSRRRADRKSTRLNSSHTVISYAVFCFKKKRGDVTERHRHMAGKFRSFLFLSLTRPYSATTV